MGNFAKNIRGFSASSNENKLKCNKNDQSSWLIETRGVKNFQVNYEYFAAQYDAGSTWVDHTQVYINPVNCFIYAIQESQPKIELELRVPKEYIFATSLKEGKAKNYFLPESFDDLFDSPIVASSNIKHASYKVEETEFHVWFIGECKPNWKRIIDDFSAFTREMYLCFGSFPFDAFHFLMHALPVQAYHGVEHLKSTVITLGPGYELMQPESYMKLLGISSHELYHAWNVKTIRPDAMLPYDYQRENYTIMGYLTEGITSYMGDLFLVQSGVITPQKFLGLMEETLSRHTNNDGRFYYSVTESSFDTWLDGYALGVPNRKTSIYVEGALLALVLDIEIIRQSKGKASLHDLMAELFERYGAKGKGVSNADFVEIADQFTNGEFSKKHWYYYTNPSEIVDLLREYLDYFGIELELKKSIASKNLLGIQFYPATSKVLKVAKDSPAEHAGLSVDDEILAVNHLVCGNAAEQWINYFEGVVELEVKKHHHIFKVGLNPVKNKSYYPYFLIQENSQSTKKKKERFKDWMTGKPSENDIAQE
jgi:predicted metalloprotease with PDZ domain